MQYHEDTYYKKKQQKQRHNELAASGFKCAHCRQWVVINKYMGTANRNHCNRCLWSKHVDVKKGDRRQECHGGMKPIGLTFKHEGYGRQGELMIIHECATCKHLSINRIAGDDDNRLLLDLFELSCRISNEQVRRLMRQSIDCLAEDDRREVLTQLFGTVR